MLHFPDTMRTIVVFSVLVAVAACEQLGIGGSGRSNGSLVSSSGGQIALADGGSLEFGITSEQYKRWEKARKGIDRRIAARFGAILQPDAPTERSIERAVAYLDSEPSARSSIEAAGMSVRAFVVMTVALEQEMRRASGQPVVRQPDPAAVAYEFPTVDTTMIAPMQPTPYPAPAYPVDTFARVPQPVPAPVPIPMPVDTSIPRVVVPTPSRDTAVRPPPTIFRRDTARTRPDTARRDTARRDTTPPPPDTAAGPTPLPPDTLPTP